MYKTLMLHHATNVWKVRVEVLPFFNEEHNKQGCDAYLLFRVFQFAQKCFNINCTALWAYISQGRLFIEMTGAALGPESGSLKFIERDDLPAALEMREESFREEALLLADSWEKMYHSQQARKLLK